MAAQIEMFGLSKREIEEKFCRSELVLLSWRSQEMSAKMEADSKKAQEGLGRQNYGAGLPPGTPDRFINEEGELDMRLMTGEEAYNFLSRQGIRLPIMDGRRRR